MLVAVGDRKIQHNNNGVLDYYLTDIVTANDYYPFGMQMPGRKYAAGNTCRYGFNGQERSTEIEPNGNSMTAEFWQYDSRIGRRWNVDPKTNASISDYSTFGNNPLLHIDPKGDTIDIVHTPIYDRKGAITAYNVTINITAKIFDNTTDNQEINMQHLAGKVKTELSRLFNGQTVEEYGKILNIRINTNLTVVKNMDEVEDSDHLLVLVDKVEGNSIGSIGVTQKGAKVAYIENAGFKAGGKWLPDYHQLGYVATHEFLHNMGLGDMYLAPVTEQIPGNYMMFYDKGKIYPTLTKDQLLKAIRSPHNIGRNTANKKEVTNPLWFSTSEFDPSNKKTRGKGGKIPRPLNIE